MSKLVSDALKLSNAFKGGGNKILGLRQSDLVHVTMKMNAANQDGIKIIGATFLNLSGRDQRGNLVK